MNRKHALALALCAAALVTAHSQDAWSGRWEGSLQLSEGSLPFTLTVGADGALLDLPTQNLYGYPTALARRRADSLELAWLFGGGQFLLSAVPDARGASGRYGQGGNNGPFTMTRAPGPSRTGTQLDFPAGGGGTLPGTLVMPAPSGSRPPLVILHQGLGVADRDGNNYNLAGRNDALSQLAQALAAQGVASYRYDKRGSGMATWLVPAEESLSFEAWIADLAACADWLAGDARFSGVWILGQNDGALVAAAAANVAALERGLIVACASADGPLDAYRDAVASAPAEQRAEGEALIAALVAGRRVTGPSDYYRDAFRPGLQPYLIEAFRHDLEPELARYPGRVLLVQGDRDMQATIGDFRTLAAASPDAMGVVVPAMNHVLKEVPPDVDENNRAFGDPSFPLAPGLAEAIAEFLAAP